MTIPPGWLFFIRLQQPLVERHQYVAELCVAARAIDFSGETEGLVCGPVPTDVDPLCSRKHAGRAPHAVGPNVYNLVWDGAVRYTPGNVGVVRDFRLYAH